MPLLIAAVLIAWGGVAFGSFQYDDFANVLNDPATTGIAPLIDRLAGGIRPLTRLSHALCWWAFGDWAGGWLLFQWLMHAALVAAVLHLTFLRLADRSSAFLAALCFALLPSSAAVIAYVSGRSIGLSTLLIVLALVFHERSIQSGAAVRHRYLALLLFLLACAARETAVIFPVLVLLWEATRPGASLVESGRRSALYFVASLIVAGVLLLCVPRYGELLQFSMEWRSPLASLAQNIGALPATLALAFKPWALSVEHVAPAGTQALIVGAVTLTLMIGTAVWFRGRQPLLSLALLWPIVALLPTHSFIAKLDAVTEGPLYLALIGPSIAASWFMSRWLQLLAHFRVAMLLSAATLAIALCVWRTVVWGNPVLLWQEAVTHVPASARAWTNLGMAHFSAGDYASARQAFATALDLDPTDVRVMLNMEALAAVTPQESERP